ncbi:MAG: hypothetical protein WAZ14_04515 [Patescibacteria group bacterium]
MGLNRTTILKHRLQIFGITLLGVAVFGGGGWLLDAALQTTPAFLIVGLVVSFPVVQTALYRFFRA